jgi:hypothetical protein
MAAKALGTEVPETSYRELPKIEGAEQAKFSGTMTIKISFC